MCVSKMNKLLYLAAALFVFSLGCKKDVPKTIQNLDLQNGLHIQLVSGNYQTDTVGNKLKDSVIFKVTNNGTPVQGYSIQFLRSGCEDLAVTETSTNANGQASFAWYLSGDIGNQSLNAVLLDANLNRRDSVKVAAIGLATSHGWHKGGCLQNFPVNKVTTLSSGRILASLNLAGYPYYSDDNAKSWKPLKTFSKNYVISKILSSGNDVFMATYNDGIFHSGDNGQSWTNISSGIIDVLNFSDMAYTPSGKLFFSNSYGLFESDDKGQIWNENDNGLPGGPCTYPVEQTNGDLYIIGPDASVYKLPVHQGTWINIGPTSSYLLSSAESLYIDNNGYLFMGGPHNAPSNTGSIYESVDNGSSWSPVFSQQQDASTYSNIDNISKINGNYYFSFGGLGIFRTSDFNQYKDMTLQFGNIGVVSYALAANSSFVIGTTGYGVYYYVP